MTDEQFSPASVGGCAKKQDTLAHGAVGGFTTGSSTVIANGADESSVKTVSRQEAKK